MREVVVRRELRELSVGAELARQDAASSWFWTGSTLGMVLAAVISWSAYKSVTWTCAHFICGWWFVIWYLLFER